MSYEHRQLDRVGMLKREQEWKWCVVVLKSVCAAKAATLLHPKRQIACSVKLCVKCKIARLPAEIETAAPPPRSAPLPAPRSPSLYPLCIALRVCGAVQLRVSASFPLTPSLIAPTHNSLARPLVCVCVCSALLVPSVQHPFKQIKHKDTKWTPLCRSASSSSAPSTSDERQRERFSRLRLSNLFIVHSKMRTHTR